MIHLPDLRAFFTVQIRLQILLLLPSTYGSTSIAASTGSAKHPRTFGSTVRT